MKEFVICDVCNKHVKPRGLGSHKRLAHQIVERIFYTLPDSSGDLSTQVAGISTQVADLSTQVADLSGDMSQVIDIQKHNLSNSSGDLSTQVADLSTQVPDLSTQVRRPSAFVPKGAVGEKKVFKTSDQVNSLKETVQAQGNIIRTQGTVINTVLPDYLFDSNYHSEQKITEKLSAETGKDLTECKRADGKHLYTKQDIFILLAKISRVNWGLSAQPQVADLLPWFNADRITRSIIADFESRFECKFDEIKRANSAIRPESNEEYISLIRRYENLKYSR